VITPGRQRGPADRVKETVWLPGLIARRNDMVVAIISIDGFILNAWGGRLEAELPGTHVSSILSSYDADAALKQVRQLLLQPSLSVLQAKYTLALDVKHKDRLFRILPLSPETIISYSFKWL